MNKIDQTIAQLEEAGFTLIFASRPCTSPQVDTLTRSVSVQMPEVQIELDDLLKFPKHTLPVIFFDRSYLSEDSFKIRKSYLYLEEIRESDELTIDLIQFEPKLKIFKKYLREPSEIDLFAPYNGLMLVCHIHETWYKEFLDLKWPAEQQAERQLALEAQSRREAQILEESIALKPHEQRIRLLLDDTGFLRLARVKSTAQRTLLSYVKEQEPEAVAALGEIRMKELMTELRDWVLMHAPRK